MSQKSKNKRRRVKNKKPVERSSRVRYPSLKRLYFDATKRAMVEYPSLLGIHECIPRVYQQPSDALFRQHGYEGLQQKFIDIDKDDYAKHASSKGNLSGHVSILNDGGSDRPVVFIMRPPDISRPDHAYGLMMALLFHELGHVDDITKSIYLSLNSPVDITAAEEYAHHFACTRLMGQTQYLDQYLIEFAPSLKSSDAEEWRNCIKMFYQVIMALYICEVLPKYSELPFESVRDAAKRVLLSEEIKKYREFAGSAIDTYEK